MENLKKNYFEKILIIILRMILNIFKTNFWYEVVLKMGVFFFIFWVGLFECSLVILYLGILCQNLSEASIHILILFLIVRPVRSVFTIHSCLIYHLCAKL